MPNLVHGIPEPNAEYNPLIEEKWRVRTQVVSGGRKGQCRHSLANPK